MLSTPTPFPFAGSKAFLLPDGDPVRVIRPNRDGTSLVELLPRARELRNRNATGNRTVDTAELVETEDDVRTAQIARRAKPKARRARTKRVPA